MFPTHSKLSIEGHFPKSPVKCLAINAGTKENKNVQKFSYSPENIRILAEFSCLHWIQ